MMKGLHLEEIDNIMIKRIEKIYEERCIYEDRQLDQPIRKYAAGDSLANG